MLAHDRGVLALLLALSMSVQAAAQQPPPASARMNEPGVEALALRQAEGRWDVIETVWAAPGAAPVVTTGLIADRRMVGSALEEVIHPAAGALAADIKRVDYLSFNRVEGR